MANIKTHLNNIKDALYGKDVRGSIHDGIDAINKEVENTTGRQVDLENTFDQLVINAGNSNAEIVDARVKNDGTSYSKLGDRLDAVDSQLAQYMNKIDERFNVVENIKATKQEVDVERKRIDNFVTLPQGSTAGDAELIDARIGSDGFVYSNLGKKLLAT